MNENQLPENNRITFAAFTEWKNNLDTDLGETIEDWEDWWMCFLAGWKSAKES